MNREEQGFNKTGSKEQDRNIDRDKGKFTGNKPNEGQNRQAAGRSQDEQIRQGQGQKNKSQ
jgi:hypothetical protein